MNKINLTTSLILLGIFILANCKNEKAAQLTAEEQLAYLEKGKAIAQSTFAALSGELSAALGEGGVANAVEKCNLVAMPLVDSLSKVHNATIRRTSLKVRNPANQPEGWEAEVLAGFEASAKSGEELKPAIRILDGHKVAFAAPIKLLPLCTKCHGIPGETIAAEDYDVIKKLYPNDEAIGYKEGDLRGMWSITFQR